MLQTCRVGLRDPYLTNCTRASWRICYPGIGLIVEQRARRTRLEPEAGMTGLDVNERRHCGMFGKLSAEVLARRADRPHHERRRD